MFWKKEMSEADAAKVDRKITISYLRNTTDEDCKKVLKIVEIYRNADEAARVVEYGSKKAANEALKATEEIRESDETLQYEELE